MPFKHLPLLLWVLCCTAAAAAQQPFRLINLKTDYLTNPVGIDHQQPVFTWQIQSEARKVQQTGSRLLIGEDSLALLRNKAVWWQKNADNNTFCSSTYDGPPLRPFTRYYWKVIIKNQQKQTAWAIGSFETGPMGQWQGHWISDSENPETKPAPYFRNTFVLNKPIRSARVYIAVAGLYELYINGEKIGNHSLDPVYTRFDRRTLYVTHDVTQLLANGNNAIGVLLGNGWYNHQSTAVWNFHQAPWRNRPTFCLDLRITYTDGTVTTITSGKDWKTALSPVIFNSIYTAEHYDARLEQSGWNTATFDDKHWKSVIYRSAPSDQLTAQAMHPVRKVEGLDAKQFTRLNDTTYLVDFGRNIAGVTEIRVNGAPGTVLRLKHGERLTPAGRVDQSNIDVHYRPTDQSDPFQTDIVILSGKGEEVFCPKFNYKGFQYVEISGNKPFVLQKDQVKAWFMHSDVPVAGRISSANPTINQIWAATNASYLSNLFGYPTDCPQREKNGWTGDAVIANETGLYSFDGITIYKKWLADHRDEQQPNGVLPSIIPTGGWGYEWGNGPDWTSSMVMIPWNIYRFYGDKQVLQDNYAAMKRYVDHLEAVSPDGICTWGLGDWVPVKSKAPVPLTSTCYYYADVVILAKTATLLGRREDARRYEALAVYIKSAFNKKWFRPETSVYGDGLQTELSAPLYWGLVPDDKKQAVAAALNSRVAADDYQLDVGLLGQKAILNALSDNGFTETAYRLAARETYPSWGWWIKNGATTLYENWDIQAQNDISLNHIMFGEIGAWLYKGLGGIAPDEQAPGFRHIIFKPALLNELTSFEASHNGPFGAIFSGWKISDKTIDYQVVIPPGSTGTVYLPTGRFDRVLLDGALVGSSPVLLGSGRYVFTLR